MVGSLLGYGPCLVCEETPALLLFGSKAKG